MNNLVNPETPLDSLSEEEVAQFLEDHPDFFERHEVLLSDLKLPHRKVGAVSLVERQVSTLRQKNMQLEGKLRELVSVARGNDDLAQKIHGFATRLLEAGTRAQAVEVAEELLRSSFAADNSILVLFDTGTDEFPANNRFLRRISRDDSSLSPFKTFMQSNEPRCGLIRDAQKEFLFRTDAPEIGSAALIPLGEYCATGLLAIGSRDAEHFNPGKSMDFLSRLGDLLGCALAIR
jgi:uncharacterized protein YigA (DUF484 family)